MPAFTLSIGEIMPGQFGPINLAPILLTYSHTFIESETGIPSVIQMTVSMPASMASMIASAAKAGGTKTKEVLALASSTPCLTVS